MKGGELGLVGDECEIDWEHMLDDVPDHDDVFDVGCLWDDDAGAGPTGSGDSWLGDLQHLLFNGDESKELKGNEIELQVEDFQLCDLLLLDSPLRSSSEEGLEEKNPLNTCSDSDHRDSNLVTNNSNSSPDACADQNEIDVALEVDSKDDDDDDPLSKKRKRQLRNRDAAMKSRERKKMYVKDLETKSRYLEAECRRLGRLLQCCYAENQMLRFSVHSAPTFGNSTAKPESAVLLPETLLLVSLVWLMGLMWVHPLASSLLLLSQGAVAVASVNRKEVEVESAARARGKGAKAIKVWLPLSYLRSKGCKASRTKMKCDFDSVECRWFGNDSLPHSTPPVC